MSNLRLFDLNLLIAFEALMRERSVTRAADRMCIGQPAMSHALARLRDLFGDELFIRVTGSMEPTPQALALAAPISDILAKIREEVMVARSFRPEVDESVFRLAASDYASIVVLPALLATLRSSAPRVRIVVSATTGPETEVLLGSGKIDLAIGHFNEQADHRFSEVLFRDEFNCVYDAKACGIEGRLTPAAFLELPHVVATSCEEVGRAIAASSNGDRKNFNLVTTPEFLTIPHLLRGAAAIGILPRRLARDCAKRGNLRVSALPVRVEAFAISMRWHDRTEVDPAMHWFRQVIRQTVQTSVLAEPEKAATLRKAASERPRLKLSPTAFSAGHLPTAPAHLTALAAASVPSPE